jgi:hypothetical protein
MVPFEREGEPYPVVVYKGKEFHAITRYGNGKRKPYTEYREIGAPLAGHGVIPHNSTNDDTELIELRRSDILARKAERRKVYEEAIYDSLRDVAQLQVGLINAANDPSVMLDYSEIAKAKVGLQAAESILNRALGKPVTKIDAEISMSVADTMMEVAEGWVVDEEED